MYRLSLIAFIFIIEVAIAADNSLHKSQVGRSEIVLPGFAPVSLEGRRIELGADRAYQWSNSLLPTRIEARGAELVESAALVVRQGDVSTAVTADSFSVISSSDHHVELMVEGHFSDQLLVKTRIRVEFDGVATVDMELVPRGRVQIDGVAAVVPVIRRRDLRLLAYEPKTIYNYNKQEIFPLCGEMPYKNAVGFADTERGFWILTDAPAFPVPANERPPTVLLCDKQRVRLVQPLLGPQSLSAPLSLRFAFLATPVKDLPAAARRDRVVPRINSKERWLGNRNLWWVEALAHYALPYVDYPPGAWSRLDAADRAAYPGLKANRSHVLAWRSLGIERLPYMSLRVPSALDPVVVAADRHWQIYPPRTRPGERHGSYLDGPRRSYFSHRAPGFSDYMLERLDAVLAELPVRGFYFDQAEPIGSGNPEHLPADRRVQPTEATDILAMREFFKRLATAIYQRGREPLIYVHNSMATVLPAYTFVTAMVQGEEFNSPRLKSFDYLSSVDFDTVQATYVSEQFGVPVIWLEELWSEYRAKERPAVYRRDTMAWLDSPQYEQAWRNFMAVALLHDIPVWTHAPPALRANLYAKLDRFRVDRSRFDGYWRLDPGWRNRSILVSLYTHENGRQLAVIVNRAKVEKTINSNDLAPFLGSDQGVMHSALGQRIAPQDFALISSKGGDVPPAQIEGLTVN